MWGTGINTAELEWLWHRLQPLATDQMPLEAGQSEASRSFAHEGNNEHQIVEHQLQKLSADRGNAGEQWMAELKVLRELVEHHVNEEESTGFSCARDEFDKDELEAMGQRFQTRKAQLMTRVA